MLSQQRKEGDTRGMGYISKCNESKPECSLNQEAMLVSKVVDQLKMNLKKIHKPLNEVQEQLILREKECEILQKEVINLKKPNESRENWRIDLGDKEVTNNFQFSRRQVQTRYQNSFFGYCFNCYRFGHKAID